MLNNAEQSELAMGHDRSSPLRWTPMRAINRRELWVRRTKVCSIVNQTEMIISNTSGLYQAPNSVCTQATIIISWISPLPTPYQHPHPRRDQEVWLRLTRRLTQLLLGWWPWMDAQPVWRAQNWRWKWGVANPSNSSCPEQRWIRWNAKLWIRSAGHEPF